VTDGESLIKPKIGNDLGWARNLRTALKEISATHIIYPQEDYLLCRLVNQTRIAGLVAIALKSDVDLMYFFPRPKSCD